MDYDKLTLQEKILLAVNDLGDQTTAANVKKEVNGPGNINMGISNLRRRKFIYSHSAGAFSIYSLSPAGKEAVGDILVGRRISLGALAAKTYEQRGEGKSIREMENFLKLEDTKEEVEPIKIEAPKAEKLLTVDYTSEFIKIIHALIEIIKTK